MANRRAFLKSAAATSLLGATGLSGCIGQFGEQPYGDGEIRFLMSPTEPQDQMRAQYTPVKERLQSYADVDSVSMKYAADYAATLSALDSGTADIAETGPFAAALGVKTEKVEIILQRYGYGGWTYTSNIVTRQDSDLEKLSDLEGKTIALAAPLSASGSLYPLYMLKKAGLSIPEEPGSPAGADFEPQWSNHAAAKEALMSGQADAAGVGYFIVAGEESKYAEGIRPLKVHDGLPRAPIIVSPGLSDEEKTTLTEAFTKAPQKMYLGADGKPYDDSKEGMVDDDLWFSKVRKADVDTYQPVIDLANELGYGEDVFKS